MNKLKEYLQFPEVIFTLLSILIGALLQKILLDNTTIIQDLIKIVSFNDLICIFFYMGLIFGILWSNWVLELPEKEEKKITITKAIELGER